MSGSLVLVLSLGLFSFCLCCPIPLCQFLFYGVICCYCSIEACFSERQKGDGSRREGRWRGDRRSGGHNQDILHERKIYFQLKKKQRIHVSRGSFPQYSPINWTQAGDMFLLVKPLLTHIKTCIWLTRIQVKSPPDVRARSPSYEKMRDKTRRCLEACQSAGPAHAAEPWKLAGQLVQPILQNPRLTRGTVSNKKTKVAEE